MSHMQQTVGVIVEGSARVSEADREAYLALVREVVTASAARSGCLKFTVAEDILTRNLFHLTELWTDMAALDASRYGHENSEILAKFAALAVSERKVFVYTVSAAAEG